jgi:hypothetical protein
VLGVCLRGERVHARGELKRNTAQQVGERVGAQLTDGAHVPGRVGRPSEAIDTVKRGRRSIRGQPHPGQRGAAVRLWPQFHTALRHALLVTPPRRVRRSTINVIAQSFA